MLVPGGRVALTVWDEPEQARFVGVLVEAIAEGARTAARPAGGPAVLPLRRRGRVRGAAPRSRPRRHRAVATIAFTDEEPSAETLWDGLMAGTVRMSALVRASRRDAGASARGVRPQHARPRGRRAARAARLDQARRRAGRPSAAGRPTSRSPRSCGRRRTAGRKSAVRRGHREPALREPGVVAVVEGRDDLLADQAVELAAWRQSWAPWSWSTSPLIAQPLPSS